MQARSSRNGGKRSYASCMFQNLPPYAFAKGTKRKSTPGKDNWDEDAVGPRLTPCLLAARGWPTTRPSHRSESLPSGCRPWRFAGPPATEQRARLGQGQSRRQAGGWYRGRTAPAHIPADPNKGTAVWAARAQAPPPAPRPRPRPRPLAGGPRGPAPGSRAVPAASLRCSLLFLFSFFSLNVLSFNVYKVCSAAGSDLGPARERKRPFLLLDSVSSSRSENLQTFHTFKKVKWVWNHPSIGLGTSKDSSKVANEILSGLFNDRAFALLKNSVMGLSKINNLLLIRKHNYLSTKDAMNLTLCVIYFVYVHMHTHIYTYI